MMQKIVFRFLTPFSPVLNILSRPETLNASGFRRACRMAISRNASSFPDFPEFAQAVSYGVPGTHAVASTLQCLSFYLPLSAVAGSHGPTAAARVGMVSLRAYRRAANRRPAPESTWPSQPPQAETPTGKPVDAPLSCSRGGERPIQYGLPGVFIPGETRSSSGALSSPVGPEWPPGPLSHSSRRIFDHARVLFGTGLGRPRRCLPPRSRIGPRRRRQQRGEGAARRPR